MASQGRTVAGGSRAGGARPSSFEVESRPDRVVRVAIVGSLTEEQAHACLGGVAEAVERLGEPCRILGNASRSGLHAPAARRALLGYLGQLPPGRVAVVGASPLQRILLRLAVRNTLLSVGFFEDEGRALAWLRAP